ncbi:MAG: YtrH family sporulation protein [Bacillota bacterium]
MTNYVYTLLLDFLIALGVVVGGSAMGALGALLTQRPPLHIMADLAERLKIWGLAAALGGTFSTIRALESGLFAGQLGVVARQVTIILSAFLGAHLGYLLISILARGPVK